MGWRAWRGRPAALPAPAAIAPGVPTEDLVCAYPPRAGLEPVEETRRIPKTADAQERLLALLVELHRPPVSAAAVPIFTPGSAPRAAFLSPDGTAWCDEPSAALDRPLGVRDELLAIRALARSLVRNMPEARSLVVLVDGATRPRFGLHLPAAGRWLLPRVATARR